MKHVNIFTVISHQRHTIPSKTPMLDQQQKIKLLLVLLRGLGLVITDQ